MEKDLTFEERLNRFIEATEKSSVKFREDLAASRAEFDRKMVESQAENAQRAAEFDRKMVESQAESAKRAAEFDRMTAEFNERDKKIREEIFGVGQNAGYHAEQYFQNALKSSLTFGGEKYDSMRPNLKHEGRETCEFDIVLVNGSSVAVIEAKNRIHPHFVHEMVEKKALQFRKYFPEYGNYKLYLGIAGFSFDGSVVEEAKEYGIGILRQDGDAVVESDTENLKVY